MKKNEGDVLASLETYTPLLPPKGKFYADPFLFKHQGIHYLFFEDFNYKKGIISYVTLGHNQEPSFPQTALELHTHLSFPSLFKEDDEIYMTPETYRCRSVFLYKAISFPNQWKRQRVLVQGEYFSDPILFKYNGYYWLFVAIHQTKLRIYYAKDLHSQFFSHPINRQNIIGRNAGSIFFRGDHMIRPTMDCSIRYGRSIVFKEILILTTTQFVEKEVGSIEPNWAPGLVGSHTYCENEEFVVYDGERFICPEEDFLYSRD